MSQRSLACCSILQRRWFESSSTASPSGTPNSISHEQRRASLALLAVQISRDDSQRLCASSRGADGRKTCYHVAVARQGETHTHHRSKLAPFAYCPSRQQNAHDSRSSTPSPTLSSPPPPRSRLARTCKRRREQPTPVQFSSLSTHRPHENDMKRDWGRGDRDAHLDCEELTIDPPPCTNASAGAPDPRTTPAAAAAKNFMV